MSIVFSADEHLVEPSEFWNEWLPGSLPPEDRDRVPKIENGALIVDGQCLPVFRMFPKLTAFSDSQLGVSDVAGRLAVMDREGIDITLLFPQRAMGMFVIKDPLLRKRCITAYNEFLAEFCAKSGGRLVGVAILPTVYQPEETADYLAQLKELGFRFVMTPISLKNASYIAPEMTPLWSAIEESGLVPTFHTSETPDSDGPGSLATYLIQTMQPFRKVWANLVFSGLLERHPRLKILFAEGGIAWVPSTLEDADRIHASFAEHLNPRLPRPPSEYWRRQCYATFMDDRSGLEQIRLIGVDRVLWSSDYPHPEGTHGRTRSLIASIRQTMDGSVADAILGGNALSLLGAAA